MDGTNEEEEEEERSKGTFCCSSLLPLSSKLLKFNFVNIGRWDQRWLFDRTVHFGMSYRTVGIHRSVSSQ
jgi:hypothetical protein